MSKKKAMDELGWIACDDPAAMLDLLSDQTSHRKLRLFAVACARDELTRAQAGQGCFNFGGVVGERYPQDLETYWDPEHGYEVAILAAEERADGVAGGGKRMPHSNWFVGWLPTNNDQVFMIAYSTSVTTQTAM